MSGKTKSPESPPDLTRSAGVPPAVAGASRPRFGEVNIRTRGRLPHWERDGGLYFITFRLADSLPREVLERIAAEAEHAVSSSGASLTEAEHLRQLDRAKWRRMEAYLDRGTGACYLKRSSIAKIVAAALEHGDTREYRLLAWCIMPNHVHVLVRLLPGRALANILHSWKSYTAKVANRTLGRSGAFWQREYYDRLVRDSAELDKVVRYIANNPAKSGLQNWPWVYVCGQDARTTAGETPALLMDEPG